MKNLRLVLFIWLCFTNWVWTQTIIINDGCNSEGIEIISEFQLASFNPSEKAKKMLGHIMEVSGVRPNFEMRYANVENVLATTEDGRRYIFYSAPFLKKLDKGSTYWGAYFLLAHEIGHHLKKHDFEESDPYRIKYNELEADVFAGAALRALGARIGEAKRAVESLPMLKKTEKRPAKSSRIEAMLLGWKRQDKKIGKELEYNDYPVRSAYLKLLPSTFNRATEYSTDEDSDADYFSINDSEPEPNKSTKPKKKPATSNIPYQHDGVVSFSSRLSQMPNFPWPPPAGYHNRMLIKDLSIKAIDFDDVDERLQDILDRQGYSQRSYYQAPGGFAIATQMEQFEEDGSIKSRGRWLDYPFKSDFKGWLDYIQTFFMAPPGRFRVFVFVVTDKTYKQEGCKISNAEIKGMAYLGESQLPLGYSTTVVTPAHHLDVLIYEFEAPQSTKRCKQKCPAFLDVQTHLLQSGLSSVIGF